MPPSAVPSFISSQQRREYGFACQTTISREVLIQLILGAKLFSKSTREIKRPTVKVTGLLDDIILHKRPQTALFCFNFYRATHCIKRGVMLRSLCHSVCHICALCQNDKHIELFSAKRFLVFVHIQ